MGIAPVFYAEPTGSPATLDVPPRLATWNAAAHPDQIRLRQSLRAAAEHLEPSLRTA